MAYEQKEGQGSLFVADQQGNPNRPNYNGSILINGQRYWISGWLKTSQGGQQYISISVQPQQARPQAPQGFQQTGQFPGQAPQYPQPQGYQQTPQYQPTPAPAPQYPQAQQYPQGQPQFTPNTPQGQPQAPQGNPFGQYPPQGQPTPPMPTIDDMPAF